MKAIAIFLFSIVIHQLAAQQSLNLQLVTGNIVLQHFLIF
jgi:hypothetical protein